MKTFKIVRPLLILLATLGAAKGSLIDGLVSYWPLDTSDGTTTPDMSFSNPLGVFGGTATVSTTNLSGFFSNAWQFNGSASSPTYLTNLHGTDGNVTGLPIYRVGSSYTVAMWVKGAAQTARYLYAEGWTGGTGPIFILQTGNAAANNTKFDVIIRNDPGTIFINHVVSTAPVFNNVWHHIAWVDDRGTVKLYVDGVLDAANFSYVPAGTITLNTTTLGSLVRNSVSTNNVFNGQMDEVATWERALRCARMVFTAQGRRCRPGPRY
jgi:hypothetical protein